MNEEVKTLWLEALRSGKYEQAKGYLRDGDFYCPLGVLCDLYPGGKWKQDKFIEDILDKVYYFSVTVSNKVPSYTSPPSAVVHWAELEDPQPFITIGNDSTNLTRLNDDGLTLSQLADLIERFL